jgi:hypothetical protein
LSVPVSHRRWSSMATNCSKRTRETISHIDSTT